MKNRSLFFLSGVIAVTIILLTGWIAFYSDILILHDICFYFHLIPFGISFSGGSALLTIIYYFVLWSLLTLVMIPIVKVYDSVKNKRAILISIISICVLGFLIALWVDHRIKKEWEDSVMQNEK